MPIIYKRSESPEFDLFDPKYDSASSSKHDLALEVDELDLLPPVAVVSTSSNVTTKNHHHQRQRASSSSSAPRSTRSTPAKRNLSQAPPPKRLRVQEEHISYDRASTSRGPINASRHHPSSDNPRRQAAQPRPASRDPLPKTMTNSFKRTRPAPPPSPFSRQVTSDEPPFGKQQHGAPTRPQPGMPTPSTSPPPREYPFQRTVKQPYHTSPQQPRPRSSLSVQSAPVVQDLSSPDHPLRPRRAIHPPDREMKLPIEPSGTRQARQDPQRITFMNQGIAKASAPPSVDEVFPPRRAVEKKARPATDDLPRSGQNGTTQQPRRNAKPVQRTSSEIERSAPPPQRNEGLMRPASVRKAQERRTTAFVVSEDRPTPPRPARSLPRNQLQQDDPIEQRGYPCRRRDPAPLPRRSLDTQAPPPPPRPPRPPPQAQSPASPPPRSSNPSPKPFPKLQFPNVETFLANLPLPLAHLTPTVAAFGCSSQADLLALSARSEGGAKARRVMMDELERTGDLTPWQRIVVEAELEVLGERAAGR
ncbi:BQ5605_C015g08022 [Microbotryum silenes-dioicae]|uniref:BQ5605_C015g08022 protein n=1 Tax=Microbotryum silenes-dioicae TaxID=796604 RepID=A0A2X0MF23_9BASI|nr:BQ5605_C015g08022 [Microbotryum silenes-dioicae]